jgi:phosphoketolase
LAKSGAVAVQVAKQYKTKEDVALASVEVGRKKVTATEASLQQARAQLRNIPIKASDRLTLLREADELRQQIASAQADVEADQMHVRGYKEKGNINTPMELAIYNQIDRFTLAMEAINRTPKLQKIGAHAKEKYLDQQTECRNYAYEHGIDKPEILGWRWSK